jgi:hypothetical protein
VSVRAVTDADPLDPKFVPDYDFARTKVVDWANAADTIETLARWDPMGFAGPLGRVQFALEVGEGRLGGFSNLAPLPSGRTLVATLHSLGLDADRLDKQFGFSNNLQRTLAESEVPVTLDPDTMRGTHLWGDAAVSGVHRLWACASDFLDWRTEQGNPWVVEIPETEAERTEREATAVRDAHESDPWLDLRRLAVEASAPEGYFGYTSTVVTTRGEYSPTNDRNLAYLTAVPPSLVLRLLGERDAAVAKANALEAEAIQLRVKVLFAKPAEPDGVSAQ